MAFARVLCVAIFLVQLLTIKAHPQALAREISDSDQRVGEFASSFAPHTFFDSGEEEDFFDSSEENSSSEKEEDNGYYNDGYDDDDGHYDGEYDIEDWFSGLNSEEQENSVPIIRVRRRIIPVGKALDRDRNNGRNPYGRGRSPWADAPIQTEEIKNRGPPAGSDDLYTLFPNLAPPQWREAHGYTSNIKKKPAPKKSKYREKDTKVDKEPIRQKRGKVVIVNNSKSYSKRKIKLSKDMKEDIATYAKLHGIEKASTHFTTKLRTPITLSAAEKYLQRHLSRQKRRGGRQG